MASIRVEWPEIRPDDTEAWEREIRDEMGDVAGHLNVRVGRVDGGWKIEAAHESAVPVTSTAPVDHPVTGARPMGGVDYRERIVRALREKGLPAVE